MSNTDDFRMIAISEKESMEFFIEGLKQASSAAKELSLAQEHEIWRDISTLLDEIHNRGVQLARSKSITRGTALSIVDNMQTKTSIALDESRPVSKKFIVN